MDIQELKKRKKHLGLTNRQLSELSGVALGTVNKILSGATKAPQIDTVKALSRAIEEKEFKYEPKGEQLLYIREEAVRYNAEKKDGEYTVEDFCALPEDVRAELIDGYLIYMETPSLEHQDIIGNLYYDMKQYLKKKKGPCKVFFSPVGVRLDEDDKTMLEPDLVVLCDPQKSDGKKINGAPDLVVEVVSPSSRKRDYLIKLNKYWKAGVREYWIVDPERKMIEVYWLQGGEKEFEISHYRMEDKVPVRIWGDCEIDFAEFE